LFLDDVELIVHDTLHLHDNVTITVGVGSNLRFGKDCVVKGACNDDIFDGQIIVENGGILIFDRNSKLFFGGEVIIDGNLIINENVFLNLYNEQTYIDINGILELGDNATFTFTGGGYIKF